VRTKGFGTSEGECPSLESRAFTAWRPYRLVIEAARHANTYGCAASAPERDVALQLIALYKALRAMVT
jgi:hypothetical protein